MMIKIDWTQIKELKESLTSQGFNEHTILTIIVFYKGNNKAGKAKTTLGMLENTLFDLESDDAVTGICIFDEDSKRPFLKIRPQANTDGKEIIPSSGHSGVIEDFDSMSPEQKRVWVDITEAAIRQHTNEE